MVIKEEILVLSSFGESNSCFPIIKHSMVWSHEDVTQDPAFFLAEITKQKLMSFNIFELFG